MARQWDLDEESRDRRFVIRPHRPNYILPLAYNTSPNQDRGLDSDPDARAQNTEVKFQISFKVKLWEDIFNKNMDLWFGYTSMRARQSAPLPLRLPAANALPRGTLPC